MTSRSDERAKKGEKPRNSERARGEEKPTISQRATKKKKPILSERAIYYEKPTISERAIGGQKPNDESEPMSKRNPKSRSEPMLMRKPIVLSDPLSTMPALVDATLVIEKLRVATQVRRSHLARQGKKDIETDELLRRLVSLEEYAEARVTELIQAHPAYYWFARVKGVGNENIAKVVGLIDIEKAHTVSSLWKFAGWDVQDGAAPKRKKGKKLTYNSQLRVMTWRLGVSLLRAKGLFHDYYLKEKDKYHQKYLNKGFKIIATPTGRFCPQCQREVKTKAAKYCPDCRSPLSQKQEPEGVIFEGHLHRMALRKMIKLFLSLLWVVWRQAQGLSTRVPYPAEYLGHDHMIEPEEMCDELEPPLAYTPGTYPPGLSRRTRVVQLRKADLSYAEIGRRLGISRERARQIAQGNPSPRKPSGVMLTTSSVAQLLGVHPNTVRCWSEIGILKSYRIGSRGDRRFLQGDVDDFLKPGEG